MTWEGNRNDPFDVSFSLLLLLLLFSPSLALVSFPKDWIYSGVAEHVFQDTLVPSRAIRIRRVIIIDEK